MLIVWVLDLSFSAAAGWRAQSFGFSDVCLGPLGLTSVLRNGECYGTRDEGQIGPGGWEKLPEPSGIYLNSNQACNRIYTYFNIRSEH